MYRAYFCSGLAMVIAVNVGYVWESPRLSCLRWHILGICHDAGLGGKPGRSGSSRSYCHTLDAAGGLGGALRGRSHRTREGRIGPTAQKSRGQGPGVRGSASSASELIVDWTWFRCYPRYRKVHPHIGMHPSAGFPSAGMVFTVEIALPTSTLQIFKGGKQVQDQHCRVSQQGRVDELYRIVWAVDA